MQLLFFLFCLLPNKPLAMYGETLLSLFFHRSHYETNFNVFRRFRLWMFEFGGQKLFESQVIVQILERNDCILARNETYCILMSNPSACTKKDLLGPKSSRPFTC